MPKKRTEAKKMIGNELFATYELARRNMLRGRRGGHAPVYETADDLREAIIEYWDFMQDQNEKGNPIIPDVEGLCTFLGVSRRVMSMWERGDRRAGAGFQEVIEQAKNDIATCKKQLGLAGVIPPIVLALDMNNNHGYVQKQVTVVEPRNPLGEARPTAELAEKYMDLIEDVPYEVLPAADEVVEEETIKE